jgi:hypothetical protein
LDEEVRGGQFVGRLSWRYGAGRDPPVRNLCRYITRPAIANERLALNRAGQVVLTLKTPYLDGTTHIVMSPLEFLQRLAALVPRLRLDLIHFHGGFAPNARLRANPHNATVLRLP